MSSAIPSDIKLEVDQVLESLIYLYTESRRITKELARRADLTGPQLTVLKLLEGVGDMSHIRLTDKGANIANEIAVEPMEIFRGALESLSPGEMRELIKLLTKIARRVQSIVKRAPQGRGRA
jgi:hypothetical protein